MNAKNNTEWSNLRIKTELHQAFKIQAAVERKTVTDLADEVVGRALRDRQAELARLRASETPAETPPV